LIIFRTGAIDAEFLEKQFMPEFGISDLVNLPNFHIYLKLLIDGVSGKPFSAATLPPISTAEESCRDVLIENSRRKYSVLKSLVEDKIASEWSIGTVAVQERIERRGERPIREVLDSGELIKRQATGIKRESVPKERPTVDISDLQKSIKESLQKIEEEKPKDSGQNQN